MKTLKQLQKESKMKLPVLRSLETGLWGYSRILNCLNLNKCVYATKRAAQLARAKEIRTYYEMCEHESEIYG